MLSDFTGADKVYIACGYTDLRRGIDGLATIVQQQFELDPFSNTLWAAERPDQGTVLGEGRLHLALQAVGAGRLPMAALRNRGEEADAAAVPLADGRAEDRTAQSAQSSDWPEYGIALKIGCYFLANH